MNRRDFLRRAFGIGAGMLAAPVLDRLCAAPVAKVRMSAAALFAAEIGEDTRILDVLEGPAALVQMNVYGERENIGLSPVRCSIYRSTGGLDLLQFVVHPCCGFGWYAAPDGMILVPRGESVCLAASTKDRGVQIAGSLVPLDWERR